MGFIKLLLDVLIKAAIYKKYAITVLSLSLSAVLTALESIFKLQFFGINYSFLFLATILIIVDFMTGFIASKHEARREGKEKWFESGKIQYTVYKFLSIFLLLWLSDEVYRNLTNLIEASEDGYVRSFYISAQGFLSISRGVVFFLICGREFVSIGENIEKRFGKKPYIFRLFIKILEIIEIKFMKKIEESDYCNSDEPKINNQ